MDLAVNSYLHALRDGDVPLRFIFNGSVFYPDAMGRLQTAQIPWEAGMYISRTTLRVTKGLFAALVVAALALQMPETVRYIKSETM